MIVILRTQMCTYMQIILQVATLLGILLRWGFLIWELIFYLLRTFCPHLGSFFCFFFVSSSLRFSQISPLTVLRWLTMTSDRNAESCNPVITAFYSCCLSHHIFDQVNLWLAWVGIETAIFYGSRWALSEDSSFNSYPSRPEIYLVKNVVW